MAPAPAVGKETPRTPTKLGRKPQSSTTSKLSGAAKDAKKTASDTVDSKKAETDSPKLPPRPDTDDVKEKSEELTEKAKDAPKKATKTAESESSEADDVTGKVEGAAPDLEEADPKPMDDEEEEEGGPVKEVKDTAEDGEDDAEDDAEDLADDTTEKAGEIGEETDEGQDDVKEDSKDSKNGGIMAGAKGLAGRASSLAGKANKEPTKAAGDLPEDAQDTAGDVADGVKETAEDATDKVEDTAEDAADTAKDTAENATSELDETAENAKETIDGATDQDLPDIPGLELLKGLEVNDEGFIHDNDGNAIGKLVEGDAEDLAGYPIGEEGEILDEDGDLVGRCELLPEKQKQLLDEAKKSAEGATDGLPDVSILKGLQVDAVGQILNDDGDTVGQLVEGDASDLKGRELNEKGEILDDEGNVVGRAEVHPEAAELLDQAQDTAEDAAEDVEDELPGVEALEGMQINDDGEILGDDGEVLGRVEEGVELEDVKGLTVNENGEVVDADGNVLGKVELAEGAAEKLKDLSSDLFDLRILEGHKVNKKGKVLDEEGEEIGQLTEGELKDVAGKKINEKGEVLDKEGNVLGKVEIVPGEAATDAMKALKERLGELEDDANLPSLDILEGYKVNKKGKVFDEDGEAIGELIEGDLDKCAGKKINGQGEVLDNKGKVIGKVKTLPQEVEEAAEDAEDTAEGAAEDVEEAAEEGQDNLPPLSTLEGLKVNKAGKLIDSNGTVVGELTEGDAKKLSKSGITCDAEGQFWDDKGHVIGRAKTVEVEEGDEEALFAGLEGLVVVKGGMVEDENGNTVGKVVEGDAKKLVGRAVDEDGDIIDKRGSVVGHAERWEEEEEPEAESEEPADLSSLSGKNVNKQGNVIGDNGVPIGRLVEGNAKELMGKKIDSKGQIWDDEGNVIGRVELIPDNERETKPEGLFAGLEGLKVNKDGKVADEDGNIVGTIVEGNAKRLVGLAVDEDGDIIDKYGNVKGHAEPLEDEEEEAPADLSILDNKKLNKQGYVVGDDGIPVGRLVEGNVKELAGRRCDGEGLIHNDTGKVVGRCELIPENEREDKPEGPFAGLEGLKVNKDGKVEDADGNVVGVIVEGNAKRLVGHAVDEDGDIVDKYGNTKGHAEPWEEEEETPADLSSLAGCTVNKSGNVVDSSGQVLGRVAEGDVKNMIGKKVDGKGQIWDNSGNVIGRAELVQGYDNTPEGPFSGYENITVAKDGTVVTSDGTIVGRLVEGDAKKLVGRKVDVDGDISDKNGNSIGKAERWEPEEKERHANPMSGRRVNKQGEVRDENGDVMGKLTAGDLGHCVGMEVNDNGDVIDNDGNKVGEVTLLENIQEDEPEEETEEDKKKKQDAELADKMANICQQTLERIQPVCKQITEHIEKADRTPRDELDEEELVNNVKPLIEEGSRILQECNGSLRGLDPDGRIAQQAKGRSSTRDATPEEYRLADCLKELTTTVVTTIDNAKKRISDMPHAKKKLNPLWSLLTEPLFQIIAAVGLLLAGVLGLVGKLLNALGLGGLVNGLLGGLGIDKLLGGLGLGSVSESLGLGGDKKKKKGSGVSNIPLVGGLLGGGK